MANEANLEFKIRADSSQAQGEIARFRSKVGSDLNVIRGDFGKFGGAVRQEMADVAQSLSASTGALGRFAGALGPAGLAIGAAAGAAVGLGSALLGVINQAAEAGDRFKDLSVQTGLSVETLSGLELSLKQNNASLETLASTMFILQKNMGTAKNEGGEMAETFKRLGVDVSAGPEQALRQLLRALGEIPDVATRNELGARAMGRGYKELSIFVNNTNGDIESVIESARRAGLVMSTEAAEGADEFRDHIEALSLSAERLTTQLGNALIPELNRLLRAFGETQIQGGLLDGVFAGIAGQARYMTDQILVAAAAAQAFMQVGSGANFNTAFQANLTGLLSAANTRPGGASRTGGAAAGDLTGGTGVFAPTPRAGRAARQGLDEETRAIAAAEKAREDIWRRAAEKQVELARDTAREVERIREEGLRAEREARGVQLDLAFAVQESIRHEVNALLGVNERLEEIDRTLRKATILEAIDAQTAAWLKTLAVVNELSDEINNVRPVGDATIPQAPGQERGAFVDPEEFRKEFGEPPPPNFDAWKEAITELKEMALGSFKSMGDALGQAVSGWLLYGGSIGKAMKQATAAVLAGLAAQAVVKAIFQLAEGFAALFFNPAEAAAHFKAAALYGAAAVAAGVGARALAGGGGVAAAGGGGAFGSGFQQEGQREDNRTRWMREQEERDRYTTRQDRRGESSVVQLVVDGRELGRAVLNHVRDGGDLRDGYRNALGVTA